MDRFGGTRIIYAGGQPITIHPITTEFFIGWMSIGDYAQEDATEKCVVLNG